MNNRLLLMLTAVGAVSAPLAWGAAGDPGTGIASSHHDFTAGTAHLAYTPGSASNADGEPIDNVGLCTYCHTPHKAPSTRLLWNHKLSLQTFSWDVPSTTAGTTLPDIDGQTYNGSTAKCLSCHDGTVAIGDVALFFETPDITLESKTMVDQEPFFVMTNGASLGGNHPVAVPYPFGNVANTYNGATTGGGAELDEWQADPQTSGIRLFTDEGGGVIHAGATAGQTGIECSSCHDPHNKKSVDDLFLRGNLAGNDSSYLCLKCHNK